MTVSKTFIPSLFTILNAFCGFLSVINSANGEYNQAVFFILFAGIFDVLDGMVARILNSSSDFGVELDSLSDIVSFGFAPSFLLYMFFFKDYNAYGIFVSSLVLAFSAIRLARFNVSLTGFNKDVFFGIPTPMSAMILCSYVMFFHDKLIPEETSRFLIFAITITTSLLMVSKFRFPTAPSFTLRGIKSSPVYFSVIVVAAIITVITKGAAIFPLGVLYVLYGIVNTFIPQKKVPRKTRQQRAAH